jgi:hypothetical protein
MPPLSDIFLRLQNTRVFSKIGLSSAADQIPKFEGYEHLTAFATPFGISNI